MLCVCGGGTGWMHMEKSGDLQALGQRKVKTSYMFWETKVPELVVPESHCSGTRQDLVPAVQIAVLLILSK